MDEELKPGKADLVTAGLKSIVGAIPLVGALVSEIVGSVIPNQRLDRMADFVADLGEKLQDLSEEQVRQQMWLEENVDLFEESVIQAARAMSPERRRQIAALFKNGLTRTDLDHGHKKRLLGLLGELGDVELLILKYLDYETDQEGFEELHGKTLFPPTLTLGAPEEEVARAAAHESYWEHLRQLRLIAPPPRGGSDRITPLGHLLLSYVDEASDAAESAGV
jgi:hypothetical protein